MVGSLWRAASVVLLIPVGMTGLARACEKPADVGAKPPRYKIHVGQELNYDGTSKFEYENGALHYKISWTLLAVRQNVDGGCRFLVRHTMAHGQNRERDKKTEGNQEVRFNPETVSLAWCDVSPDGRVVDNPTLGFTMDVSSILPRLPGDAEQRAWQSEIATTGARHEYTMPEQDTGETDSLQIQDVAKSPTDEIYLSTSQARFTFDKSRGLVDRIETETTQGFGFNGKGTGVTKLTSVERRDPNLATGVAVEMSDYFAVKQEYDELLARAGKEPLRTAELLATAKANLEDLRKSVRTEPIVEQLDRVISQHEQMAKYAEEEAKRLAEVLGKPSPAWETTDLGGSTRSIEACRGKVVVLDFWYRGCGWCIRAMPQVKQVAAHFQGRPVEVFGMNTDQKEDDARFVVEKMTLTYPTLKAEGLPEKYGVQGFPTLLIIDQAGMVRDVHVGYSPTLAKSVIASVEKLLANQDAGK